MAEEEEVIILEEERPLPSSDSTDESSDTSSNKGGRKRLLLFGGIGLTSLVILLLALWWLLVRDKTPKESVDTGKIAKKIQKAGKVQPLATPSQIERMIEKANILYEKGNKKEALDLFEQVATYSASLSYYNLGVAQMRQEKYDQAIESFKKAIQNGENRCISALNAAVSALHLGDEKLFKYFLQMAEASLPDSYNSSLYGYLYALINYYKGNYFETLGAVVHPTSSVPNKTLDRVGAVGFVVFDRPYRAIDRLEKRAAPTDYLILGQLYAQVGNYPVAVRYLRQAIEHADTPVKSRKALALVELKHGMPQKAADLLEKLTKDFKGKGEKIYPIHARLATSVYEIEAAQRRFSVDKILVAPEAFKLLFEFAPFKVFNANQTLNYIKKGNAAIYVDETPTATKYLTRSSSISRVNLQISKAIKAAIDHRLRRANALLEKALKRYPNHSILHYDLALTYAQLGNYTQAHKHFLRSYHLDASNYLSAIFALMCETLTGEKIPQIEQFVSDDLSRMSNPSPLDRFHRALFYYYRGNLSAALQWVEKGHTNRPLYLLLDTLIEAGLGRWDAAKTKVRRLRARMPRDVLANLLYLQLQGRHLPIKRYSALAQQYLKTHPLDLDAVYYGSAFTRENYIALRFITGTLYPFMKRLQEKLLEEREDPAGIIEGLALSDIYLQRYEKAYVLLNELVDRYKMQDSRTLFLTAVAAIGADHHADASALLQLAKMTDPNNLESRYALGLLYLEDGNTDAAVIQFSKIPDGTFQSEYFDFDILGPRTADSE